MEDRLLSIAELQKRLATFAAERDWQQFHSPKNLSMALAAEAGELLEIFQWLSEEQSRALATDDVKAGQVADELADIVIYVTRLADALEIDLNAAVAMKMLKNADRYPADRVRGSAAKYTEYTDDPGDHPAGADRQRTGALRQHDPEPG